MRNHPFGCGDEIVEYVLLVHLGSGQMPGLAIFAAAAQVHLGIDAAGLEERNPVCGEGGGEGDVESAIAIKQDGIAAVEFYVLLMRHEHRDAGAVLALEEHLLHIEFRQVEICLRLAVDAALASFEIVAVDCAGSSERRVGIEAERLVLLAGEAGGTDSRKFDLPDASAGGIV